MSIKSIDELKKWCDFVKRNPDSPDCYLYCPLTYVAIIEDLLNRVEKVERERDQALAALKQAKKTLKAALKTVNSKRKGEQ